MSEAQRQKELNWLQIKDEIILSAHKMTHKVMNNQFPAGLAHLMEINKTSARLKIHKKLAPKPKYLAKNKLTQSTYCNRSYRYNILPGQITSLQDHSKLKKWAKVHLQCPSKVPEDLNRDNHR